MLPFGVTSSRGSNANPRDQALLADFDDLLPAVLPDLLGPTRSSVSSSVARPRSSRASGHANDGNPRSSNKSNITSNSNKRASDKSNITSTSQSQRSGKASDSRCASPDLASLQGSFQQGLGPKGMPVVEAWSKTFKSSRTRPKKVVREYEFQVACLDGNQESNFTSSGSKFLVPAKWRGRGIPWSSSPMTLPAYDPSSMHLLSGNSVFHFPQMLSAGLQPSFRAAAGHNKHDEDNNSLPDSPQLGHDRERDRDRDAHHGGGSSSPTQLQAPFVAGTFRPRLLERHECLEPTVIEKPLMKDAQAELKAVTAMAQRKQQENEHNGKGAGRGGPAAFTRVNTVQRTSSMEAQPQPSQSLSPTGLKGHPGAARSSTPISATFSKMQNTSSVSQGPSAGHPQVVGGSINGVGHTSTSPSGMHGYLHQHQHIIGVNSLNHHNGSTSAAPKPVRWKSRRGRGSPWRGFQRRRSSARPRKSDTNDLFGGRLGDKVSGWRDVELAQECYFRHFSEGNTAKFEVAKAREALIDFGLLGRNSPEKQVIQKLLLPYQEKEQFTLHQFCSLIEQARTQLRLAASPRLIEAWKSYDAKDVGALPASRVIQFLEDLKAKQLPPLPHCPEHILEDENGPEAVGSGPVHTYQDSPSLKPDVPVEAVVKELNQDENHCIAIHEVEYAAQWVRQLYICRRRYLERLLQKRSRLPEPIFQELRPQLLALFQFFLSIADDDEDVAAVDFDTMLERLPAFGLAKPGCQQDKDVRQTLTKVRSAADDGDVRFSGFLHGIRMLRRREITESEEEIEALFTAYDSEKSGFISNRAICSILLRKGLQPKSVVEQQGIAEILEEMDADGSAAFTLTATQAVVQLVKEKFVQIHTHEQTQEAQAMGLTPKKVQEQRYVFLALDVTGDGALEMMEVERAMDLLDRRMSMARLQVLFNEVDQERVGQLDFVQFLKLMRNVEVVLEADSEEERKKHSGLGENDSV